jgi:hypothetical protein
MGEDAVMKPDEHELLKRLQSEGLAAFGHTGRGKFPRAIGTELGIHPKRVSYLCQKWDGKGWYDYGICDDLGWLTEEGMAIAL